MDETYHLHSRRRVPFIAADVGGTHARVGLLRAAMTGRARVQALHVERYTCADWPGLADILADFVTRLAAAAGQDTSGPVTHAVLACAGYVEEGILVNANLPWPVSIAAVRQHAGLQGVDFINDFEALAHAVPTLDASAMRSVLVRSGSSRPAGLAAGPIVVMGPGTGLGCAAVLPGTRADPDPRVLPSEAAHILLAPGTPREAEVLRELAREPRRYREDVEVEHALSGPGLLNLYRAIARLNGSQARLGTPADVTRAALQGESAEACEALEMFCGLLGSFAADMAIVLRASGGVILAGGILPQIEAFLRRSSFERRFLREGALRPFLQHVPVHLVDHGELGIVGAGCWSLQHRAMNARGTDSASAG